MQGHRAPGARAPPRVARVGSAPHGRGPFEGHPARVPDTTIGRRDDRLRDSPGGPAEHPAPPDQWVDASRSAGPFREAHAAGARGIASRAIAGRESAACVVWDRTVLAAQDPQEPVCGMAFDIGSTKLAGFLLDLRSGETKATVSAPNPQISHGEDIMARLAFVRESPEGLAILREKLLETMNDLLRKACGQARVSPDRVYHVTAVGNTAMHHIFLGLPAGHLATAPYRPATRREIVRRAGPFR